MIILRKKRNKRQVLMTHPPQQKNPYQKQPRKPQRQTNRKRIQQSMKAQAHLRKPKMKLEQLQMRSRYLPQMPIQTADQAAQALMYFPTFPVT